jgi:RNA polymerase sigma-70 factor (ECF subfamily)
VTNRCINHLRYRENRQRLLREHDPVLRGPVRTPCDEQVIGIDLLVKLMERLDDRCSEVLIFRYFDDMPQEEIARLLKTSRRTVGKRIRKIKAEVLRLSQPADQGGAT